MDHNPYDLKQVDEIPTGYLDSEGFLSYLKKNKILVVRKDNLPRLAHNNNIEMRKLKRIGKFGSVPTIFKTPTVNQIKTIIDGMRNNNNSLLGREILKKKKAKILEIFDKAADQEESRTSIAAKVAESLDVSCNRKLVRSVLDSKRSSKLDKLKKIS